MKEFNAESKRRIYESLKRTFDALVLKRPEHRLEIKLAVKKIYKTALTFTDLLEDQNEEEVVEDVLETIEKCREFALDLEEFIEENKLEVRQKVVDIVWPKLKSERIPKEIAKKVVKEAYHRILDEFRRHVITEVKTERSLHSQKFRDALDDLLENLKISIGIEKVRRRNDNRW